MPHFETDREWATGEDARATMAAACCMVIPHAFAA
jgi:hypothetical protein